MNCRVGEERYNNQGCLMKIIKYNDYDDIVVEFQDEYKEKAYTSYKCFSSREIKNHYHPSVCGVGIIGNKYPVTINGKVVKEYDTWKSMLRRCFDKKEKEKHPEYKDITCCEEWLLYDNFYEWLHSQENFDKWYNGSRWAIDKDVLFKGNKVYSPKTCCLVPDNVNSLFTKRSNYRGDFPIGMYKYKNGFQVKCSNPFTNKVDYLGYYQTTTQAFRVYKAYKENLIKQVAQMEFSNGNITEKCYNAMMNYIVEITD